MIPVFEWFELPALEEQGLSGTRDKIIMGKLVRKVPMEQSVITEDYQVWDYCFNENNEAVFTYRYTALGIT